MCGCINNILSPEEVGPKSAWGLFGRGGSQAAAGQGKGRASPTDSQSEQSPVLSVRYLLL